MIFRNGTLAEGKDGCAARHRLDHHQAERLRPTLETRMATGTVKWFNPTKGYGFIEPTGAGKDMFVHISAVEQAGLSTLNEGQSIEYEIESNRGKESVGMSLLSVGGASSRRSQHLEVRKARQKCDRVSADTKPTELRLALPSNTAL
jgi:CspA family cold shock protein